MANRQDRESRNLWADSLSIKPVDTSTNILATRERIDCVKCAKISILITLSFSYSRRLFRKSSRSAEIFKSLCNTTPCFHRSFIRYGNKWQVNVRKMDILIIRFSPCDYIFTKSTSTLSLFVACHLRNFYRCFIRRFYQSIVIFFSNFAAK